VTGGASGIGLAISERLAADGAAVAIFDRDERAAEEAATKVEASGARAMSVIVDVT
jgi:NAD(P)-dependent dehydrogenase (short-subunit alcohol dehydrogenase family)